MKLKNIITTFSACLAVALSSLTVTAEDKLPTKAYICGQIGSSSVWDADNTTPNSIVAEVNGDAQYQAEWKVADDGGATQLTLLALSLPNITSDSYPDIDVNINRVIIDGVEVPNYKMSPNAINTAYYEAGRDPETRVYLYDEVKGTNVADLPKLTQIKSSIKVIFTVTGTGQYGTSNIEENLLPTQETTATEETTVETTTSDVSNTLPSSTTGDAGVAVAAAAGLVITAGAAILSKVKFKKKK